MAAGVVGFGWAVAGLSCWAGEALITPRGVHGITREDCPFWYWFFVILYVTVGILFLYGGIDGLIHGNMSTEVP
jgi:hypothetical protein